MPDSNPPHPCPRPSQPTASQRLRRLWSQRGGLAWALWPLSLLWTVLAWLRRGLYRWGVFPSYRADVPVMVIGNVIAGGAGKTPVTLAVVEHLRACGWHPGIVSRGYGRSTQDCRQAHPHSGAHEVGDEPALIAQRSGVAVFVARQRSQAIAALRAAYPQTDVIVCDDGLQHLALAREVEICVFNDEGVGNGFVLPAGPLREPWPRRVTAVLHAAPQPPAGTTAPAFALQRQLAPYAVDAQGRQWPLAALRSERLHALAAIARPEEFFTMLRSCGLTLARTEGLADHDDLQSYRSIKNTDCTEGAAPRLICTEKDAVKLWPYRPDALAVPLQLHIDPAFWTLLDAALPPRPKAAPQTGAP